MSLLALMCISPDSKNVMCTSIWCLHRHSVHVNTKTKCLVMFPLRASLTCLAFIIASSEPISTVVLSLHVRANEVWSEHVTVKPHKMCLANFFWQRLAICYGALVTMKIYRGVNPCPLNKDDFSCQFVQQSSKIYSYGSTHKMVSHCCLLTAEICTGSLRK